MDRVASTTLGSTTTSYTYDGAGTRTLASTGTQASKKTNYDWDPNGALPQLVAERHGNAALLRRYRSGLDTVTLDTGGSPYYYHHDGLGSVVNLTSLTGITQWTYDYLPYGGVRTETKNQNQAPVHVLRYTGELLDPTALYHLRARQYDPGTGRFLSADPALPAITNPYSSSYIYAAGNPVLLVDPSGRDVNGVCINAEGALAFVFGEAALCIALSDTGQGGVLATGGGGGGVGLGATAGLSFLHSDAAEIYDHEGPFVIGGGSGAIIVGLQGEGFVGFGHCGQVVTGGTGGVVVGATGSVQAGATGTVVLVGLGPPRSACIAANDAAIDAGK